MRGVLLRLPPVARWLAGTDARSDTPGHGEGWAEFHCFRRLDRHLVLNVETLICYAVDPATWRQLRAVGTGRRRWPLSERRRRSLRREGFLRPPASVHRPRPRSHGLRHLELMVTHACNMRCRYCYGQDEHEGWQDAPHLYGASAGPMSLATAQRGVDWLIAASGGQRDLSIIFFGGEPLLAMPRLRELVPWLRERERASGKRFRLSLSTNGVALSDSVVAFLDRHRIGCQLSIDGPPPIQDRNRPLTGGRASHARVSAGAGRLLRARPGRVRARVTVAGGDGRALVASVDHLRDLGFAAVQYEPVIHPDAPAGVDQRDVAEIKAQTEVLARRMIDDPGHGKGYANLERFVRLTAKVDHRSTHHCGAGRSYLALGQDGVFYPCHRFVGMDRYAMGNLDDGFDATLGRRMARLTVDRRPGCSECWARYFCGGGCWKHGVDMHGRLAARDEHHACALIRHQLECALAINAARQETRNAETPAEAGP